MEKTCSQCGETKDINLFYKHPTSKDGFRGNCKFCEATKQRARYHADRPRRNAISSAYAIANPERAKMWKRSSMLANYGLTLEDFDRMITEQRGVCYLCGEECRLRQALSVDHDHTTGKVRKLLCHFCNTAIGFLQEDPTLMRRAADYIEEYSGHYPCKTSY